MRNERTVYSYFLEMQPQVVLAAFTDDTPIIPELMTMVERDWVKLAYAVSQLPWVFQADGGELDAAVREKLATSEWPSKNSFTA